MLLRGLNFTSPFLFSSRTVLHRARCFTMGKESFELSHIPACSFPDLHPSPGCSCVWGNNLLRWQLQKSITPWMPWAWRTETAQKHATAHWHLYTAPHHTSSAGTEATDENICSKTFSVLSLRFGVVFFLGDFLLSSCRLTLSFTYCELYIYNGNCFILPSLSSDSCMGQRWRD